MFGNAAQSEVLDSPQFVPLRIVLSAQAIGELTALACPADPAEYRRRELAGFLFGRVFEAGVHVETVRQLPSENGSLIFERFTKKQFDGILRSSQADESLTGLAIVGWYRFHPARDLRLEPAEIDFHEKFFPNHEHIGLILRPDEPSGLTALICARSQDGTFSRTQHSSAALSVNSRRIARAAVELQSGPKFGEEAYIQAYRILETVDQHKDRRKWIVAAALVGAMAVAGAYWFKLYSEAASPLVPDSKPPSLSLTLSADGPNLLVSWMGGSSSPKRAHLKIFDGDVVRQIDLTKTYNPAGSLEVPRHSGNVQAVIEVSDGVRNWQSQSSLIDEGFLATKNANAALAAAETTPADQSELAKLKDKNRRLEATVDSLRQQLEFAPHRKRRRN
jgi:hypothetical protein